jgi:hypothetical protein
VLCRDADGGDGGVARAGTPNLPTNTGAANVTPTHNPRGGAGRARTSDVVEVANEDVEISEDMNVDRMPDPFPQSAHVGDENVIYSQMELLDTDRQFRYAFVSNIVSIIGPIAKIYYSNDVLNATALHDAMEAAPADKKLFYEIAYYVYTNVDQKFDIKGQKGKKSFLEYYASQNNAWKAEWLYVMIFLMRQQQWSKDSFDKNKQYIHDLWKQTSTETIAENIIEDFETLLLTADNWIRDIIRQEPPASTAKKARVVDRRAINLMDLIEENNLDYFIQFKNGIDNVSRHFEVLYQAENGKNPNRKAIFEQEFLKKPLTMRLYPLAKSMFEKSNFRFKLRYPLKLIQWQYWIMRAIASMQNEFNETELWYGYLDQASKIETNKKNSGHYKTDSADFPLKADFDSLEDDITHNAIESLSTRIDRLNDW